MLMRTTLLRVALTLLAAAVVGESTTVKAQMPGPSLQPGVYDGIWHGDQVRFAINRVAPNGRFSGQVTFDPNSNFPGYRFSFTGRIRSDGSLFVRRLTGGNQIARTGPPIQDDGQFIWQGDVRGQGLNGPAPFELDAGLPR